MIVACSVIVKLSRRERCNHKGCWADYKDSAAELQALCINSFSTPENIYYHHASPSYNFP